MVLANSKNNFILKFYQLFAIEPKHCVIWSDDGQQHPPGERELHSISPQEHQLGLCPENYLLIFPISVDSGNFECQEEQGARKPIIPQINPPTQIAQLACGLLNVYQPWGKSISYEQPDCNRISWLT